MKASELKQKTKEELRILLREKKAKICELRMDLRQKKNKNTKEIGAARKDAARILTVLNF